MELLGYYIFYAMQWAMYLPLENGWAHGLYILGGNGTTPAADGGVEASVSTTCDFTPHVCSAFGTEPFPASITAGSLSSYGWIESDDGPASSLAGHVDYLDHFLGIRATYSFPGATPATFRDTGHLAGRCDSVVPNYPRGCVDEDFIPTLKLPVLKYGAAAAMIGWAQDHLNAAWGLRGKGKPLTYRPMGKGARDVVCNMTGAGAFVNMGRAIGGTDGSSDSCDEFPFAASGQSAGLPGGVSNGGQCAQVEAFEPPGSRHTGDLALDWSAVRPLGTPSPDAKCVRGHIPLMLNTSEGSKAYGPFVKAQRLLPPGPGAAVTAGDPFWVQVIPIPQQRP